MQDIICILWRDVAVRSCQFEVLRLPLEVDDGTGAYGETALRMMKMMSCIRAIPPGVPLLFLASFRLLKLQIGKIEPPRLATSSRRLFHKLRQRIKPLINYSLKMGIDNGETLALPAWECPDFSSGDLVHL
jgi:hypothetical protein